MNCLSKILDACIVERRGNPVYVRRIVGLWIATLTTLQTV